MTDFAGLFQRLGDAQVNYILVGGVAAGLYGSARTTTDVDIVYERSTSNLDRIVAALAPLRPYLRGAPEGLPFRWNRETLERGLNFTLTTALGDIDLLGEIAGGGTYSDLLPYSVELEAFRFKCLCLDLDMLIRVKRAAGRPKDFEAIAELEAIREERGPAGSQ